MPSVRTRWWLCTVALASVGVACLLLGLGSGHRDAAPVRQRTASAGPTALPGAATAASGPTAGSPPGPTSSRRRTGHQGAVEARHPRTPPARDPAAPTGAAPLTRSVPPAHLAIPAIGVSHDLLRLGLHPDHTVEVPPHAQSDFPGWFRLGPTPGSLGSAVVLGHVDSLRGPAVFYRLRLLQSGDRVDVRLVDGTVAHFAVRSVATYANAAFPARQVYGPHGYAGLNLVTCGGAYDAGRGGYQSNVVVYARLVGTSRA